MESGFEIFQIRQILNLFWHVYIELQASVSGFFDGFEVIYAIMI